LKKSLLSEPFLIINKVKQKSLRIAIPRCKNNSEQSKTINKNHFFCQMLGSWYSPTPGLSLSPLVKSIL
jgi:hypothetical protein